MVRLCKKLPGIFSLILRHKSNRSKPCVAICCFISCFLFNSFHTSGQSWQWGARGGGITNALPYGPTENVLDICTDKWGNIYVLANVFGTAGINIAGHSKTGHGDEDICITSFKCDGTYRWSKVIGADYGDYGVAIKADTLGGVYISAGVTVQTLTLHIDSDTSLTGTNKGWFIMKYDTGGTYKWLTMPQPDTASIGALSFPMDMDVDGAGNIFLGCELAPGAYAGGSCIVTTPGVYIMKYTSGGIFSSVKRMDISDQRLGHMIRDHRNGKIYVAGTNNNSFYMGSHLIDKGFFVGCYDSLGNNLWAKQDTAAVSNSGIDSRPALDKKGFLYITGTIFGGDLFNGVGLINLSGSEFPFLIKLDSNGNSIWTTNAATVDACKGWGVAATKDTVAVTGLYVGAFQWGSHIRYGSSYQVFLATFAATSGATISVDTLTGGANPANLCSDIYGNFYAGGQFSTGLTAGSSSLTSAGGETDFFIAQYGSANCSTPQTDSISILQVATSPVEMITIYPNPVTHELHIEGAQHSTYDIYNVMGQPASHGTIGAPKMCLTTDVLPPGYYMLQIVDQDGNRVEKAFIKQ